MMIKMVKRRRVTGRNESRKGSDVGWDKIRGTRAWVGERRPTVIEDDTGGMVGRRSLRDLVPPYSYARCPQGRAE